MPYRSGQGKPLSVGADRLTVFKGPDARHSAQCRRRPTTNPGNAEGALPPWAIRRSVRHLMPFCSLYVAIAAFSMLYSSQGKKHSLSRTASRFSASAS